LLTGLSEKTDIEAVKNIFYANLCFSLNLDECKHATSSFNRCKWPSGRIVYCNRYGDVIKCVTSRV